MEVENESETLILIELLLLVRCLMQKRCLTSTRHAKKIYIYINNRIRESHIIVVRMWGCTLKVTLFKLCVK